MLKKLFFFLILFFTAAFSAQAVCPVCTIAVGAGVGFSRWLGVDDLISGTWVGGLIVSMAFWFFTWLDKKNVKSMWLKTVFFALFYAITVIPLYWSGVMGHPFNTFCGLDRLLFGIIAGSIAFLLSIWLNVFLKKRHNNKAHFPFQKIVISLVSLAITSLIFYIIIKC